MESNITLPQVLWALVSDPIFVLCAAGVSVAVAALIVAAIFIRWEW